MNKKILAVMTAIPLLLSAWVTASAQEDDAAPLVTPVDTFTCKYNEGKGPADLSRAITAWNTWMDEQDAGNYGAITFTPYYFSEAAFDVAWLGFWTSQEAMGAGIDSYLADGGAAAQGFNEVLTCQAHEHWASVNIKPTKEGPSPDNFVLMFSDCSREDGVEYDALFDSLDKLVAYENENDYENATWFMWPVFGGGGESEFEFKAVTAYDNYTSFGKAYQHRANGGGRQARNEIMGGQLDCDVSRVYNATTVRRIAEPDGE